MDDSIESIESVGPLRITSPSSLADLVGRTVMMEESEGGACPTPLTTEVLQSEYVKLLPSSLSASSGSLTSDTPSPLMRACPFFSCNESFAPTK